MNWWWGGGAGPVYSFSRVQKLYIVIEHHPDIPISTFSNTDNCNIVKYRLSSLYIIMSLVFIRFLITFIVPGSGIIKFDMGIFA